MLIKHKNMRDVAGLVVEWPRGFSLDEPCTAKVWWVNLNKHIDTGKPFVCSPKPETILIKNFRDWEELDMEVSF
jgi:hypothetical protein